MNKKIETEYRETDDAEEASKWDRLKHRLSCAHDRGRGLRNEDYDDLLSLLDEYEQMKAGGSGTVSEQSRLGSTPSAQVPGLSDADERALGVLEEIISESPKDYEPDCEYWAGGNYNDAYDYRAAHKYREGRKKK